MGSLEKLINHLRKGTRVLQSPRIVKAFKKIDRKDFLKDDYLVEAYEDYPIPIGFGQTISQPTTVAFMLELLNPQEGEKVLDLGSGSGWTTALLGELVGSQGKVFGVERIPKLVSLGRKNLEKYKFSNTKILQSGKSLGLPKEAPFDKILVSAEADEFPEELFQQLRRGGILVLPWRNSLWKIKKEEKSMIKEEYPGFVFVPLLVNGK